MSKPLSCSAFRWVKKGEIRKPSKGYIFEVDLAYPKELHNEYALASKKLAVKSEFNEKPWMELYIRLNTELRIKVTSDFEKNFFKLMNKSVCGKTMENIIKKS